MLHVDDNSAGAEEKSMPRAIPCERLTLGGYRSSMAPCSSSARFGPPRPSRQGRRPWPLGRGAYTPRVSSYLLLYRPARASSLDAVRFFFSRAPRRATTGRPSALFSPEFEIAADSLLRGQLGRASERPCPSAAFWGAGALAGKEPPDDPKSRAGQRSPRGFDTRSRTAAQPNQAAGAQRERGEAAQRPLGTSESRYQARPFSRPNSTAIGASAARAYRLAAILIQKGAAKLSALSRVTGEQTKGGGTNDVVEN